QPPAAYHQAREDGTATITRHNPRRPPGRWRNWQRDGLLIRRFRVRVPGGPRRRRDATTKNCFRLRQFGNGVGNIWKRQAPAHVGAFVIRGSWGMSRSRFRIGLVAAALALAS